MPRDAPPDATAAARERELRQELYRVDRVLEQKPPTPPTVTAEEPVPERGAVIGSGGHPQPTPTEIQERQRQQQQKREAPPPVPTRPVYDLFGERLQ